MKNPSKLSEASTLKRSAARPQDLADIAELEKIKKLKQSVSK